ncbi:MAG: prolyl-tRNA synthetase [Candidatus Berkelbacteria bacterium Licking1014_7]|uniref:Proline--tRNA ligase n=1 Tax=Candidatus Berkelbacteria bacterium Licking1014_7 TaxID=2017147 RepID=A0A554LJN2_9BACT|nr:MAG: prolyl-tRNA synthetase [Candidatus Berkelbacteria bacterium Licking1014_7]
MLVSKLFTHTQKQDPKNEEAKNACLLTRAGFVYKNMAGVYSILPLGFRVLQNIRRIIREELQTFGAEEVYLNELQNKETWSVSGRWNELKDVMYQFSDSRGKDIGLATTHEEVVAEIAKNYIHSYKDLPKGIFQIQDKFRNEPRARSGLLRGREFEMKDLYSFHADEECLDKYYQKVMEVYIRIFGRLGLDAIITNASGGTFTRDFSHEFQVISENGEDTIYVCEKCHKGKNKEIVAGAGVEDSDLVVKCDCGAEMKKKRSIEVGNIFKLGVKFSQAVGLNFSDKDGNRNPVIMASYGIGTTRVLAAIAEVLSDKNGLVWNAETAPYQMYLIDLTGAGFGLSENLSDVVLMDDRDASPGEKFADADLLGIPYRVVKSKKTADKVEVKERVSGRIEVMEWDKFLEKLKRE